MLARSGERSRAPLAPTEYSDGQGFPPTRGYTLKLTPMRSGLEPNTATTIRHRFEQSEVFKLSPTGAQSSIIGDMNALYLKISVKEN